jgi:hypothetical protein
LGLDIATWKAFRDERGGYLHLIGQCATGADWRDKLTELTPQKWLDHMVWAIPPVRFFATPFVLRAEEFRRVSMEGGLILDRPRLWELAGQSRVARRLVRQVESYCRQLY